MKQTVTHPVVIGGGPVGLVLALSLQQSGVPVTVLEAQQPGAMYGDGRALALSYGTRQVLEQLGVWNKLASTVTAIETIHVSQQKGLGRALLKASEHQLPALGYVVSYGALMRALDARMAETG
ncbi:MAG TPA: FAD-dependent monooxygenase, partial [Methylophilus sp.]|nr:FAD-dependent monooxygenase [Methylophilus sp.]HSI46325.1 FAD-dependent monooxygenase [Methylophilus sp.]